MKYKIIEVTFEDLEEILKLQKKAFQENKQRYNDDKIPALLETLSEIQQEFTQKTFFKAVLNDEIVGSIKGFEQNGTCFVGRLVVNPNYQNQGIGASLLRTIEEKFTTVNRFEIFTGHKDEKNLYLYKKFGYQIYDSEKFDNGFVLKHLQKFR